MATGVTRIPISGSDTPASHGPGADVDAADAPELRDRSRAREHPLADDPGDEGEAPHRADVVQPVPGVAGRCRRRGHGEAAGNSTAMMPITTCAGVGGTAAGPQAARRIKPPPRTSSPRYSTSDCPGAAWSTAVSKRTRTSPAGAARLDPRRMRCAVGPQLRLASRLRRRRTAGNPPARRRLDGAPAQRFPRADDDGVALGDQIDHVARCASGVRRGDPQAGSLPHGEERQAVVPAKHGAAAIGDVAGCETPGEPDAELGR